MNYNRRLANREGSEGHKKWLVEHYAHLISGVCEGEEEAEEVAEEIADKIVKLEENGIRDRLTGVFNRGFVGATLGWWLKQLTTGGHGVGVIMLDLDHFKSINDGEPEHHDAGDRALVEAVKILQEIVGERGVVGRWGGEEFVIAMPDMDEEELKKLAGEIGTKMKSDLAKRAKLERAEVTTSMGAKIARKGDTEVVDEVDQLLYKAKEGGRNRMVMVIGGKEESLIFGKSLIL